jgi:hypothetical protein
MIDTPAAKALNDDLLTTIRMQRHNGTRVIVSTQEPTLLTDLIALCSVAVIHRFTSPEWFSAIKRHIPIDAEDKDMLMRRIEGLKTGTALVYSPNSVLGWEETPVEDGNGVSIARPRLIKGTGKMLRVSMRKRITSDGGASILAV